MKKLYLVAFMAKDGNGDPTISSCCYSSNKALTSVKRVKSLIDYLEKDFNRKNIVLINIVKLK